MKGKRKKEKRADKEGQVGESNGKALVVTHSVIPVYVG